MAKALNYAIQQAVDIINLSLTGPPDPVLERLVQEALSRGIVVVGAKPAHGEKAFPVSISGTIAVAMPSISSRRFSAPGQSVLSTLPNKQYDFFDGSSFSTAHVSGLVALLRSLSPELTSSEIIALLDRTANPETGEANACRAVDVVMLQSSETLSDDNCTTAQLNSLN